ncbi:Predicted membrane protein [Nocardia africana]|uniref:Predicted membrane protein n=2 Tax=Nocardia africana TaxID=134964 RepID=A0A378WQ29_9NOCA|nr:Predicted membrane protein [Nocardia africana]
MFTHPMTFSQPPANQPQSAGLDKKTSAILSYALGWLTGIIFLFVGKHDPDVKFHASQSIVFFGAVSVLNIVLSIVGSFLGALGIIFSLAGLALAVFTIVVWIMAMVQANNTGGVRAELPIVGKLTAPYADRLANAVK